MMDSEEGGSGLFWWLMLAGLLDIFFGSETVAGFMRLFQLLRCGVSEAVEKFCTHWEMFFLSAEVVRRLYRKADLRWKELQMIDDFKEFKCGFTC